MVIQGVDRGELEAILLRVILCIMSLFVILGCHSGEMWESDDPRDVLRGYFLAAQSGDNEGVLSYLSSRDREVLENRRIKFVEMTGDSDLEVKDFFVLGYFPAANLEYSQYVSEEVRDSYAVVSIGQMGVDGSEERMRVKLIKEDGRWKIVLGLE